MNAILKKLRKAAPDLFAQTPVRFAYLYGSYARGVPHRFSDLDIGIYVDPIIADNSLELELSLSLELDKILNYTLNSEVRAINRLPLTVQGNIVTDGILIYSADETERVEFETRTRNSYFDFLPAIRYFQSTYRNSDASV